MSRTSPAPVFQYTLPCCYDNNMNDTQVKCEVLGRHVGVPCEGRRWEVPHLPVHNHQCQRYAGNGLQGTGAWQIACQMPNDRDMCETLIAMHSTPMFLPSPTPHSHFTPSHPTSSCADLTPPHHTSTHHTAPQHTPHTPLTLIHITVGTVTTRPSRSQIAPSLVLCKL